MSLNLNLHNRARVLLQWSTSYLGCTFTSLSTKNWRRLETETDVTNAGLEQNSSARRENQIRLLAVWQEGWGRVWREARGGENMTMLSFVECRLHVCVPGGFPKCLIQCHALLLEAGVFNLWPVVGEVALTSEEKTLDTHTHTRARILTFHPSTALWWSPGWISWGT